MTNERVTKNCLGNNDDVNFFNIKQIHLFFFFFFYIKEKLKKKKTIASFDKNVI